MRGQQQRRCLLREESRVPDVEYARVHRRTRPPLLDQQRTHNNPRPVQTPPCGQPWRHPSLVRTHQFRTRATLRIADNHDGTHHWRTPMKTPGRNHPAGRDLPMRGHIGCGASTRSHDDAYCSAKVEYRTSSTPAYTDELDLLHSTNNAPTTTRDRFRLRLADNPRCTHDWCGPTNSAPGPHSSLRTTTAAPIIGAHPRTIDRGHTPHSGQLRLHQQPVLTHGPRSWRSRKSSRRRCPTWANTGRKQPARQRLRRPPPRNSALRTTCRPPSLGTPTNSSRE